MKYAFKIFAGLLVFYNSSVAQFRRFTFDEFLSIIKSDEQSYIKGMKARGYLLLDDEESMICKGEFIDRGLKYGIEDKDSDVYAEYVTYLRCPTSSLPFRVERGPKDSYLYYNTLESLNQYGFTLINNTEKTLNNTDGTRDIQHIMYYNNKEFELELKKTIRPGNKLFFMYG